MRACLWLSIALVTIVRLALVASGPDLDTDAYGHAMAGRLLLEDPSSVAVHWVWLPLWHYIHACIAAASGAIEEARLLNVALGVLPGLLLARLLRGVGPAALGAVAGSLVSLWPLAVELGQTAQPEPLFLALTLGACVGWREGRFALVGALLSAAALCRYEGWVLLPVYLGLWWRGPRTARAALAWMLPGVAVAAWCLWHWHATGEPLRFLRENREFAQRASLLLGADERLWPWHRRALWYPVLLPSAELWLFAPALPLGAVSLWRRRVALPPPLLWGCGAVLIFLSYGWFARLNLGLHRHLYSLLPLFATLAAAGLIAAADALASRAAWAPQARALPVMLALFAVIRSGPSALWNFRAHRGAFASALASAGALRAQGPGAADRFVCDLSQVELIARLPRRQVIRRPAAGLSPDEARALTPPGGRLFVVTSPREAEGLAGAWQRLFLDHEQAVLLGPPAR